MDDKDRDERIRRRAYRLWQEEGCPEGREAAHWDMASELVAIEESYRDTLKPNPLPEYENNPTTEPVEPIEPMRNLGEFPTLVDQGEEETYPDRAFVADADEPPLSAAGERAGRAGAPKGRSAGAGEAPKSAAKPAARRGKKGA
ncbi:MAG: hypothetical protein JWN93_1134 [Hyphomicrobiales bacterium]|nr:hypothetical protein [Hyphomicrobiales bacterium]